jgi:hypothetical protein
MNLFLRFRRQRKDKNHDIDAVDAATGWAISLLEHLQAVNERLDFAKGPSSRSSAQRRRADFRWRMRCCGYASKT